MTCCNCHVQRTRWVDYFWMTRGVWDFEMTYWVGDIWMTRQMFVCILEVALGHGSTLLRVWTSLRPRIICTKCRIVCVRKCHICVFTYCHLLSLCIYMPVVYDERVRAEAILETQTNIIVVAFRVLWIKHILKMYRYIFMYIYTYVHICIHIYIYIYIVRTVKSGMPHRLDPDPKLPSQVISGPGRAYRAYRAKS